MCIQSRRGVYPVVRRMAAIHRREMIGGTSGSTSSISSSSGVESASWESAELSVSRTRSTEFEMEVLEEGQLCLVVHLNECRPSYSPLNDGVVGLYDN